jgi:hypothetical protein
VGSFLTIALQCFQQELIVIELPEMARILCGLFFEEVRLGRLNRGTKRTVAYVPLMFFGWLIIPWLLVPTQNVNPRSALKLLSRVLTVLSYRWDEQKDIKREEAVTIDGEDRLQILRKIAHGAPSMFS